MWHFCKACDSIKLERVQERGLREVYCNWNSTYSELLNSARLPTLLNRRLQDIATIMYRVKKQLCPKYISDLFLPNNTRFNLRVKEFVIPRINTTNYGKHPLRYVGPFLWSKLDTKLRNAATIGEFKRAIRKMDLKGLACGYCNGCPLCNS